MYVRRTIQPCCFLISIQLRCQCPLVWWSLQVVRKPRLFARLHKGQPRLLLALITYSTISRLLATLRMSTCAPCSYTCVAWYGFISGLLDLLAQRYVISPAVRSPRDEATRWEDLFLPRRMQCAQARLFLYSSSFPQSDFRTATNPTMSIPAT